MVYHPDGATIRRSWWGRPRIAVGWLDPAHPYPRGEVPGAAKARLRELAKRPVRATRGYHKCLFCPPEKRSPGLDFFLADGRQIALGYAEIDVPSNWRRTFAAPTLIVHYVEEHGYCPPPAFLQSLLRPTTP